MKTKEKKEKTVVIDIKVTRKVVAMLTCILALVAALIYLGFTGQGASASGEASPQAGSDGMRRFYLTASTHFPTQAPNACAPGYHFASLWEILDPSNLEYNNALGGNRDDSGSGPPTDRSGWVRTGYASAGADTPGYGNCDAWTSNDFSDRGSRAYLDPDWSTSPEFGVWIVETTPCEANLAWVWCVEN